MKKFQEKIWKFMAIFILTFNTSLPTIVQATELLDQNQEMVTTTLSEVDQTESTVVESIIPESTIESLETSLETSMEVPIEETTLVPALPNPETTILPESTQIYDLTAPYTYQDFIIEGSQIISFSDQGYAKSQQQPNLTINLPGINAIAPAAFQHVLLYSLNLGPEIRQVGNYAFANTGLSQVTLDTQEVFIGDYAFANNQISQFIETESAYVNHIGAHALENNLLTQLVTSANTLGSYALANNQLTQVRFIRVNELSANLFAGNPLNQVTIYGSQPTYGTSTFNGLTSQEPVHVFNPQASYLSQDSELYLVNPVEITLKLVNDLTQEEIQEPMTVFAQAAESPYKVKTPVIEGYEATQEFAEGSQTTLTAHYMPELTLFAAALQATNRLLSVQSPTKTAYYGRENVASRFQLSGAGLQEPLTGAYLDIIVPATLYPYAGQRQDSLTKLITSDFIDNFSIPTISEAIITGVDPVRTVNGESVIRIHFSTLDQTTLIGIPYSFSFTNRVTPEGFAVQPRAVLYDAQGNEIERIQDKTFTMAYPNTTAVKYAIGTDYGNSLDGQTAYAGLVNQQTMAIDLQNYALVPFYFTINGGSSNSDDTRRYEKIIIEDKLPSYINSQEQTVYATFDPARNPGWTYDATNQTVRYELTHNVAQGTSSLTFDLTNYLINQPLLLGFPDAKVGQSYNYTNTVNITGIPYNAVAGENRTYTDNISFKLGGDEFFGAGMFAKRNWSVTNIPHDQAGLYATRLEYSVNVTNKLSTDMKNIVFVEDGNIFDSRLFLSAIDGNLFIRNRTSNRTVNYTVRAYRPDGSYQDFPRTSGRTYVNPKTEAELNNIASQVQTGQIAMEQAPAVNPEFTRFEIRFPSDVVLKPSETIDFIVYMAFKDPYKVPYSAAQDIQNTATLKYDYETLSGQTISRSVSSSAAKKFVPFTESITLTKNTSENRTGNPGENISFTINVTFNTSKARYLNRPTVVDLLPAGVTATANTRYWIPYKDSSFSARPLQIIENYAETGRTAIVIELPSGLTSIYGTSTTNAEIRLSGLVINEDILPSLAETPLVNNDNLAYFYFNDNNPFPEAIQSANKVADIMDINLNGNTSDTILRASSKVLGQMIDSVNSVKGIRSTEPITGSTQQYLSRPWVRSIETQFGDYGTNTGLFQYDLQVRNYFNTTLPNLTLYDVLPRVDDGRGSEFSSYLQGPVELWLDGQNISNNFDVYYRTDPNPSQDALAELNSPEWTQNITDYSQVTAIKVVKHNDYIIQPYKLLHTILNMRAPNIAPDLFEKTANNNFYVSYERDPANPSTPGASFGVANTVSNKLPLIYKTVEVNKVWDGPTIDSITYQLLQGGVNYGDPVTVTSAQNWAYRWDALPFFDNAGNDAVYTVLETLMNGVAIDDLTKEYTVTMSDDLDDSRYNARYQVTNTNINTHTVSKVWEDNNNQDGKRPSSVQVQLMANGQAYGNSVILADGNQWSYTWKQLPAFIGQERAVYSVEEVSLPEGYTGTSQTNLETKTTTLTNTYTPQTTSVTGVKIWQDNNNQDGIRPDSITVNLFADGVKFGDSIVVTEESNWTYSFDNLPMYQNGSLINYSVLEDPVENYTTTYSGTTITNSYTPGKTSHTVTKVWNDNENQDGRRPSILQVELYANGTATGDTAYLFSGNNWSYTWTDLDLNQDGQPITYSVQEQIPEGYSQETPQTTDNGTILTNTYTPETRIISGQKYWRDGNNAHDTRPASITVNLYGDGEFIKSQVVEVDANGQWIYEFTDLPVYSNGRRITYTLTEDYVAGYNMSIEGYNIVNTLVGETEELTLHKIWNDNNNQDGLRPDTIQVQLYADGDPVGEPVAFGLDENWVYTWTDMPVYNDQGEDIYYSIEELNVPEGYTAQEYYSQSGFAQLVNTHDPEYMTIEGQKTWADNNNEAGERPAAITVNLMANGIMFRQTTVIPDADGNWTYKFVDVPKYHLGQEVSYTLTEDDVPHYIPSFDDNYNITNTYSPGNTNVTISKAWFDLNDAAGTRPDSIQVQLLANGLAQGEPVTISEEAEAWTYTWTELPIVDDNEARIRYSVEEINPGVNGYTSYIDDTNIGNIQIVNRNMPRFIDITGTKTWDDENDIAGLRPTAFRVYLQVDGVTVASRVIRSDENGQWTFTFENMPEFDNGQRIQYGIIEETISFYEGTIEAPVSDEEGNLQFNLINRYVPGEETSEESSESTETTEESFTSAESSEESSESTQSTEESSISTESSEESSESTETSVESSESSYEESSQISETTQTSESTQQDGTYLPIATTEESTTKETTSQRDLPATGEEKLSTIWLILLLASGLAFLGLKLKWVEE